MQMTLRLPDTRASGLFEWFRRFAQETSWRRFELPGFREWPAGVMFLGMRLHEGPISQYYPDQFAIYGEYHFYDVLAETEKGSPREDVIRVITNPLDTGGVEVTIESLIPEADNAVRDLLRAIHMTYPEPKASPSSEGGSSPPSSYTEPQEKEPVSTIDAYAVIGNRQVMAKHMKYYSPETAIEIAKALPEAWKRYINEGGRWGPGQVRKVCLSATVDTIGRYVTAFKKASITEIDGVELW